ncbi:Type II secretory pathway ATPase GspE/PulE or T4P pilus assembly pathway ATPase PilB [Desulfonatronum thiosulfatophilum]|uniref:Type II secretory pathway ATPase GspE/PulE or T4P pilus assembly pathway ATPase PilB n=1 Tax=Desulfonatronum thiosulfatophilum TaxID=617002 RepID=A0A1G6AX78_9BACT|nr:GspE/PulE family protein [Desulfonatronum thiosulfatophilum]SDB12991.1 Type II secretory pathway ATPase GspE/PulE or T4P pilus assembly pathway ATPase PilB [Desulfonatronum thiosulfatophilum]
MTTASSTNLQGEALFRQGRFQEAATSLLDDYRSGKKTFAVITLLIQSLRALGQHREMADFLAKALMESSLTVHEQAALYYQLGQSLFQAKDLVQAKQAFWQAHRLNPNHPGLAEKLKAIGQKESRPQHRYSQLISKGDLAEQQLAELTLSAKENNEDLDQLLLREAKISKQALGESLATFYEVPFVDFDPNIDAPFELLEKRKLDPEYLKRSGWTPLAVDGNTITVLMANPFDHARLDEIRFIFGTSRIEPKVALISDIHGFIELFYRRLGSEELMELGDSVEARIDEEVEPHLDMETGVTDSEVVRLVNALLVEAWRRNASDIHIEPDPRNRFCSVRFRIDGSCHEFRKIRAGMAKPLISRIKIMAHLNIAERRLPQDGKIKMRLPELGKIVEFRVAILPTIENHEDVVLRLLASGKPLPLEKLGMSDDNLAKFKNAVYKPYGLIVVVGPTGSGKTTSLHSAISYINTSERKIWTAEDPVEITQEGLRQVQINPKIGLDFATTLRSFLRADPDVIMIGEMRDAETAHIGVQASLTGHLVFSTLHTNSAPETITRLLDMDLDPFNFADSLLCVVAQRLIKTLCTQCKEAYRPAKQEVDDLQKEFGAGFDQYIPMSRDISLYRAKGCGQCNQGYRGRIGVHELMASSTRIKNLIKRRGHTEEIRDQAVADGMLTLKQDALLKVLQGVTDMSQVRSVSGW